MPLRADTGSDLLVQLDTLISKADTTNNLKSRLDVITQGCIKLVKLINRFSADESPELAAMIGKKFKQLEGRVMSRRVCAAGCNWLSAKSCLSLYAIGASDDFPLSREGELIDDLAEIVREAAEDAYALQVRGTHLLSYLSPSSSSGIGFFSLHKTMGSYDHLHYTVYLSPDYHTDRDSSLFENYQVLIDEINRYGSMKCSKTVNTSAETDDLDAFIERCLEILTKPVYEEMAASFREKLTELREHINSEQKMTSQKAYALAGPNPLQLI